MNTKTGNQLADLLFPTWEDEERSESILNILPEQRKLITEVYDFSVSTLIEKLKSGDIFIPRYQRKYVWNDTQASRLIESLIIQCPIPVIYLNQEKDEKLAVIDGNQRLNSLMRFTNNEYPLRGLTTYPELESLYYDQLDKRFQRHIENRALRCIVISKETHPQVKFDVFERLNTGAAKLTPQELRHGTYYGKFFQLIEKLSMTSEFVKLLDLRQDKRMKAEELAIRFLALHFKQNQYEKPMAGFLNQFCEENRNLNSIPEAEMADVFQKTVSNIHQLFGSYAFKIFDSRKDIASRFNAALFDAEMVAVSTTKISKKISPQMREKALALLAKEFETNSLFVKSITASTSDDLHIKRRIAVVKKIIQKL